MTREDSPGLSPDKNIVQIMNVYVQYLMPFATLLLLLLPHADLTIPIVMLLIIGIKNNSLDRDIAFESILWVCGGVLFTAMVVLSDEELVSNGLFLLNISLILTRLNEIERMISLGLYSNLMIFFTLSHQILLSLFVGFSLNSVLILAVLVVILQDVNFDKDIEIISILFGLFLGVRAVSWSIAGGFFSTDSTITDPLLENWIKFISSPILGVILFYVICYVLEQINVRRDNILEEA